MFVTGLNTTNKFFWGGYKMSGLKLCKVYLVMHLIMAYAIHYVEFKSLSREANAFNDSFYWLIKN